MSPDIEWHIGDEAGEETIRHTMPHPPRWRKWIMLIVVALGVGLGIAYRSIPGPPRPTPTPLPTVPPPPTKPAMPARLYETIDREAQALADGDAKTYLALHVPQDTQMTDWQRNGFVAWGRPTDDSPLYTIIDFNLRASSTRAWAYIRQFRNGRSFRETRFYVWNNERWLRSDPDPLFWSNQVETLDTPHFHVIYFVEDRDFVQPVIDQLEKARSSLCADLGCDAAPLTYTLKLNSSATGGWSIAADGREISFASPRIMGVYENAAPLGDEGLSLISMLAWTTVQQAAYGQIPSLADDLGSNPVLWAVSGWATMRAADRPDIEWLPEVKAELQKRSLPLEMLWDNTTQSNYQAIYSLAYATIHFIDQEYGASAVAKILKSMATAQSFSDVIENGLDVPFAEFDQKWEVWVKQNLSSQ